MVNIMEEILDLKERHYEWKKKRDAGKCPDCGFWLACPKCSERYSAIDREIRKSEGRDEISDYFFVR